MSTPRFLLDLDTVLRIARAPNPHFARRLRDLQPGDVAISVITFGELLHVAPKAHRLQDALPIVALSANAAEDYARLRDRAARSEFGPVAGPAVENWLAH